MADEESGAGPGGETPGSWRQGWASAGAIAATILLIGLIVMVAISNRQRDEAFVWERQTYNVMLLTRSADATMARSEAALGRYVLNEDPATGTLYYHEWRASGRIIAELQRLVRSDPKQRARIDELKALYQKRGQELSTAANAAAAGIGSGGVPWFFQAGMSETGPALRRKLDEIAAAERVNLRQRMEETRAIAAQAQNFTQWLGWLGLLIAIGAIVLGLLAYRAITERLLARQEAETEANRAMALDRAVQERTRELRETNDRLREEAAERAAAEAQLRQVQKMEAVGQLTGGIAHDFNNMLAVIVGGIDLARRQLPAANDGVALHLDNAMEGATRAAALTRRLLAFARSEALVPEAVAPAELVKGMLDLVDRSIGERITIETEFPEEPWHVWADISELENAILNLCVNARDAMHGQGQLTISVANVALKRHQVNDLEGGDYIRISVADTGTGIPPELLERVFEPFFTTKPVGKGTGLGLSQLFGFARQSGGDVAIQSAQNVGTTVSIYLPRSTRTAGEIRERVRPAPPVEAPQAAPDTFILVVEDDARVSRATVGALEELGYIPLACSSGAEALEILEEIPQISLVITDVMMPEMTGPELVGIIGERFPHMGILFVTGFVGEAGEAEALTDYDLLRKPFTVAGLANAVAAALRRVSGSPPASASEAAE
jgi:signal transduction histidine kinase/ActR/RegA family two-component response regulator